MANITKFPRHFFGQLENKVVTNPKLSVAIDEDDLIINLSSPILYADAQVSAQEAFILVIRNAITNFPETIYVKAGEVDVTGTKITLSNLNQRGINASASEDGSIDFESGDASRRSDHPQGSEVRVSIHALDFLSMREALQGNIASGGKDWLIGNNLDEDITVYAANGDVNKPFWRYDSVNNQFVYSNDGIASQPFGDGSGLLAGKGIETITNGFINIDPTDRSIFAVRAFYIPAYLTSGISAEDDYSAWAAVTDGSFRITIEGTAYNVDGIDFTGVNHMGDVADRIQTAIRTLTGETEIVDFNSSPAGKQFRINSSNFNSNSSISVLSTSTGTVGTDISGAGASAWMDAEEGRGLVTAVSRKTENYLSAYLTGGNNAQSDYTAWAVITNGTFKITLDGAEYDIGYIDFTGVTSMEDVAYKIQEELRLSVSWTKVIWDTDHFVITSADNTVNSEVSILSATGSGTDISGEGVDPWIDANAGRGVATPAELDPEAELNKVPVLDELGTINPEFIPKASEAEAIAGVIDSKYMTPLKTKQVVDGIVLDFNKNIFFGTANEDILGATTPQAVATGFTLGAVGSATENLVETGSLGFSQTNWQAQTFTLTEEFKIDGVMVALAKDGTVIEGFVYCDIRNASGNIPTGNPIETRSVLAADLPLNIPADYTFDFSDTVSPIYLGPGTYSITIRAPNAVTNFAIIDSTNYNSYPGGNRASSTDSGSSWTPHLTNELYFRIDGQAITDGGVNLAKGNDDKLKNFIGFVDENFLQSENARVLTGGVIDGFTGLDVGKNYHLSSTAGAITTTTSYPLIGRALSSTELLIINQPS